MAHRQSGRSRLMPGAQSPRSLTRRHRRAETRRKAIQRHVEDPGKLPHHSSPAVNHMRLAGLARANWVRGAGGGLGST